MEDLSAHILDIVENSINANAKKVCIRVDEDVENDRLVIEIRDDGKGLSKENLNRATDPFFTSRTTRRVGLGLPLLAQAARAAGGSILIDSEEGRGTVVRATFGYSHIDRQPLGDVGEALSILIMSNPGVDFVYEHNRGDEVYHLDTTEMKGEHGDDNAHY